ncbi:M20 peptidase aminoacylase family protein [Peribacillus sp. TH16]|uniref:M20 peptidase aminoacylase family protein n=1 Tax=Peribacillus sp. TH16 TaxID=2798482 RepID=UPI001911CB25|nr:M20 peptidase aminoacylase family protein [Peribacillus sp. TH16]MBK5483091.1 M20 peptidase aminoacylase family protein [Peribacillus sp. TH16]
MKELLKEIEPQVLEIFRHLHENPEVSWKEFQTTSYISKVIQQNGLEVTTFSDMPGVIGKWSPVDSISNLTIGLRADMDALLQDVDGTFRANHSCGHDAHMTIVLGVLLLLRKMNIILPGTLKFIFQPAEEVGEGALKIIEKQVLDDVDFLYGLHLRPIQEIKNGQATSCIIHGSADTVFGEIHGFDGHGARPHLTLNAIEVISAIVEQIKGIRLNPQLSYSVKMTQVSAGGENANIIPGSSKFSLDLRAQTNEAMDELIEKVDDVLNKMSVFYQCQISFKHKERVYAASVDQEAAEFMEKAIENTLGAKGLVGPIITPGGEDFHFYTKERPAIKATMLGVGCDLEPGLHHPNMVFNQDAIFTGIEILTRVVIETFEKYNK